MTTRLKGFAVTFDKDYREDDIEALAAAIRLFRGVVSVEPVNSTMDDHMNRQRIRHELGEKLMDVVYPEPRIEK